MTTKGDIVRYDSARERYGIGSTNQVLSVTAGLPAWKTLTLADSVLTTAGDVLYENNTPELARLPKGSDDDVLTLASGLPSWAAPAGGGGSVEYIDTETITGSAADFSQVTFSTAVDFTAYSEMYCSFSIGTVASRDITFRFGDTDAGAVNTGSYYTYVTTDNTDGTLANEVHSGQDQGRVANHPRIDAQQGVSGLIRIYLTTAGDDDTHLQWNSFVNGWDSFFIGGGQYTQIQDDLKYFQLYGGGNDIQVGGNITYYKVKRS